MRRLIGTGLGLTAAVLLAGCATVGPNYSVPARAKINLPSAQAPFIGAAGAPVTIAPVPDRWWRLYDSPALDGLIDEALAANTDLRIAAANLARVRAISSEARSAGEPRVTVGAEGARAQVSGEAYLLTQPVPAATLGDVGLQASYQIDLVGRLRRAAEAANADAEASRAGLDLARISVVAEVVRNYVDACAAGHEFEVARSGAALQARTLDITRRLVSAGRGSEVDVTRGRVLVEQSLASTPVFEARRRADLYRLATLTGRPPAEFPAAVAACAAPPRLNAPIPVGDGVALLRRRPDVRQAERALAAATARIGVATAALYPSVSLGLGAGSTGFLADLGQPAANHWSAGSLMTWTLPGGGERARIRGAEAGAEGALARFDGVVLTALRETETCLDAYARELDRNAHLHAARDDAAVANAQAQTLYQAGRVSYLSGLDTQRTLYAAEAALAASDAKVAEDQVALFLALGGGWRDDANAVDAPPRSAPPGR